eukprot:339047-Chlamydomonas_euryale.AAC.1
MDRVQSPPILCPSGSSWGGWGGGGCFGPVAVAAAAAHCDRPHAHPKAPVQPTTQPQPREL